MHLGAASSPGSIEALRLHAHVLHEATWPPPLQANMWLGPMLSVVLGILERASLYAARGF